MAISVVMPALEMAQETGKLVSWLKTEGEAVRKGEMLIEVETDKAVVEIEAAADGVLAGVTAQPGDVVPVGQTIAWLLRDGEAVPVPAAPAATGRHVDTAAPSIERTVAAVSTAPASGPVRMSPRARGLAKEHGIDVSRLTGSGPGGEILAEDILAAARAGTGATGTTMDTVSSVGRLMAERTTASWTTVPHFFVTREVDATALTAARARLAPGTLDASGVKLTVTDLVVSAVARVLARHPRINASWADAGIVLHDAVNVAVAIAVDQAVVTAVLHGADRASLDALAAERDAVARRARANRLTQADITGATFTISNLGMFGVDAFTAIIVAPQAAILAVSAIVDRVVAVEGQPAVRPMMTLTLSADHRVVDGARAAAFMVDVVQALEAPGTWSR